MIKLKNVSKTYRMGETVVTALSNISLVIKKGEFVAITGPSGSGKSTLLHILSTLDRPTAGEIIWDGENLKNLNDKQLAQFRNEKIGFVFQQFHLLPKTTVLENILLPTIYRCQNDSSCQEKAIQIAKEFNLFQRLNHTPAQLSGGQQQRVAIARALINDPQTIIADEPTGNLDSKAGRQVLKILKNLNKKRGITLIVVTHNLEVAKLADRIIALKDGKIVKKN